MALSAPRWVRHMTTSVRAGQIRVWMAEPALAPSHEEISRAYMVIALSARYPDFWDVCVLSTTADDDTWTIGEIHAIWHEDVVADELLCDV